MNGRDWQTAAIPVITMITALILKKFILQRDPKNVVLINFSVYSGLLYIMTCQHFLFQRFGMIFFTSTILLIPELLASVGVDNGQVEVQSIESSKVYKNKEQKKKALQERRQIKSNQNMHKYIYYYAVAAVLFIGLLYNVWILMANRVNLIPYVTFFSQK